MSIHQRSLTLPLAILFLGFAAPIETRAQAKDSALPIDKLPAELREAVKEISREPTVSRTLGERTVACSTKTYAALLDQLPLASATLRAFKLGTFEITRAKNGGIEIDDPSGAFANCHVILDEPGRIVFFGRGFIEGKMLPRVKGRAVITVRWRAVEDKQRTAIITDCRIDFRLENRLLHRVTRPFRKVLGGVVDHKIRSLLDGAVAVSELIEQDPESVYKVLSLPSSKLSAEQLAEYRKHFLGRSKEKIAPARTR